MPSESRFEPCSQRYGLGLWLSPASLHKIWGFWGLLGPFPGHMVELEGRKGLKGLKPHIECTHPFPSFGRFEWVLGLFWPKNGCFWP